MFDTKTCQTVSQYVASYLCWSVLLWAVGQAMGNPANAGLVCLSTVASWPLRCSLMQIPSVDAATCFVVNAIPPSTTSRLGCNPGSGIALLVELRGRERAKVPTPALLLRAYRLRDPGKLATCSKVWVRHDETLKTSGAGLKQAPAVVVSGNPSHLAKNWLGESQQRPFHFLH